MREHNGAAPRSRTRRIAQLGRELAAKSAELEALAVWAAGLEEHQVGLEILAAEAEEDRQDREKGIVWLS